MFDPDEVRAAEGAFNNATVNLKKMHAGKPGFGDEAKYAETYQRLVLMGVVPQLKLKYRRGR